MKIATHHSVNMADLAYASTFTEGQDRRRIGRI